MTFSAGAGKTYTMVGTDDDPGIMVRALNDLFFSMEKTSDDMKYKVTMSYLEVCTCLYIVQIYLYGLDT